MTVRRDAASACFFDAAGEGRLVVPQCRRCGHWTAPYSFRGVSPASCSACGSSNLEWSTVSGDATLVTWTIMPTAGKAEGESRALVSGIAELVEGPWLLCAVDVPLQRLASGLAVRIGFSPVDHDVDGREPVPVCRAV
jgi:uncharacterized protein